MMPAMASACLRSKPAASSGTPTAGRPNPKDTAPRTYAAFAATPASIPSTGRGCSAVSRRSAEKRCAAAHRSNQGGPFSSGSRGRERTGLRAVPSTLLRKWRPAPAPDRQAGEPCGWCSTTSRRTSPQPCTKSSPLNSLATCCDGWRFTSCPSTRVGSTWWKSKSEFDRSMVRTNREPGGGDEIPHDAPDFPETTIAVLPGGRSR